MTTNYPKILSIINAFIWNGKSSFHKAVYLTVLHNIYYNDPEGYNENYDMHILENHLIHTFHVWKCLKNDGKIGPLKNNWKYRRETLNVRSSVLVLSDFSYSNFLFLYWRAKYKTSTINLIKIFHAYQPKISAFPDDFVNVI